jgi:glycosyltransferase involved in cell wall biosynthesis
MRVLSVNVGFGPLAGGGAERNYQMAAHLLEAGIDVRLLITDKWLVGGEAPPGYPFPRERLTVLPLIDRRFDITLPRPRLVDAAVRDADVIHILQYMSPIVPPVCSAARRHGKPWVVSPVGLLPLREHSIRLKHTFQAFWGNRILREASRLIAVTPAEQATIAPYAASPNRVVVIPNAIEVRPASAVDPVPQTESRPFLLFLGGFNLTKGADLLVKAFAQVSRTQLSGYDLVLAGDSRRGAIEALVERLGLGERTRFAGWLAGAEKEQALARASFVVIPSKLDAMTIVVLEAAAAGKPVLMTTGCGFPDVEESGGGHLVEPSVDDLRRGLQWMVDHRESWPDMGRRMKTLVERYSWSVMTQRYIDVFRGVLNETG